MAEATRAIVDAAKQKGPERVVMLSSFVAARDRLTPVTKVVTGIAMGSQIKDKTAGEEVLRASGLDWTIVYPTKLTNGPKSEARVVPENEKVGCRRQSHARAWPRSSCRRPRKTSTAAAASSSPDDTAVVNRSPGIIPEHWPSRSVVTSVSGRLSSAQQGSEACWKTPAM